MQDGAPAALAAYFLLGSLPETIGGLQTYVSEPEGRSKAKTIVFLVNSESYFYSLLKQSMAIDL